MKKMIIGAAVIAVLAGWSVRFYTLNGSFKIKTKSQRIVYSMNESVSLSDSIAYNMIKHPDYDIAVVDAEILDSEDLLNEVNKKQEDFLGLSERYLVITLDMVNNGDNQNDFDFYSIPVLGTNWYTFYDPDATKYVNGFEGNERAKFIRVGMDGHKTVKVAYRLNWISFNTQQWNNLENEKMWLSVTELPEEKRIAIKID